jgi:hypothetical protein
LSSHHATIWIQKEEKRWVSSGMGVFREILEILKRDLWGENLGAISYFRLWNNFFEQCVDILDIP